MEALLAGIDLHIMSERLQRQMEAHRIGSLIEEGVLTTMDTKQCEGAHRYEFNWVALEGTCCLVYYQLVDLCAT